MDKKELLALVRKYLKGIASPEEKAFVEAWYREMDSDQPIGTILPAAEIEQLEAQMFRNIEARTRKDAGAAPVRLLPAATGIRLLRRTVAVAASLIFIITGSWFLYHRFLRGEPALATLYTQPGKVSKVTLSDGTLVWLNADSRLKFPKSFGGSDRREIFLEGEAYFEVAKDPKHPFLVHTSTLTTRVLGTSFNVKAYPGNQNIEVTLLEGKVMLTAPSFNTSGETVKKEDTLYLDPDQKAYFSGNRLHLQDNIAQKSTTNQESNKTAGPLSRLPKENTRALLKETIADAEGSAAWRNGELVFRQESLSSVIETLSRKYDIHIKADSGLQNQSVTATIYTMSADEALLEVTRLLKRESRNGNTQYGDKVQFRKEGNVYFIE